MSWQLVRGPSGKVCFELDAERALIRIRHGKDCTGRLIEDELDLAAFGLRYTPRHSYDRPDGVRVTVGPSPFSIDFSPEK